MLATDERCPKCGMPLVRRRLSDGRLADCCDCCLWRHVVDAEQLVLFPPGAEQLCLFAEVADADA